MLTKICSAILLVIAFGLATPAFAQPADYDTRTTDMDDDDDNEGLWGLFGLLGALGLLGLRRRKEERHERYDRTVGVTPAPDVR